MLNQIAKLWQLISIADHMHWNGNFWQIDDLKNVSQWLAQFRTKQDKNWADFALKKYNHFRLPALYKI